MEHPASQLARLAGLLDDSSFRADVGPKDGAERLWGVRFARIQRLTHELERRIGLPVDEVDCVAMRLLLDEYAAAVGHLRGVAHEAGTYLDDAARALSKVRRALRQPEAPRG